MDIQNSKIYFKSTEKNHLDKIYSLHLNLNNNPISSILNSLSEGRKLSTLDKKMLFKKDCIENMFRNKEIATKESSILRIISYNVHMWTDLFNKDNVDQVFELLINELDGDILILEECGVNKKKISKDGMSSVGKELERLGYDFHLCGCKDFVIEDELYGNMIIAKKELQAEFGSSLFNKESRCYVKALIKNVGPKDLLIYGKKKKKQLLFYDKINSIKELTWTYGI